MVLRGHNRHQFPEAPDHLRGGTRPVRGTHKDIDRAEAVLLEAERLAYASLDVVALRGRRGVLSRHQHSQPRRTAGAPLEVEGVAADVAPRPVAQQVLELRAAPQAARGTEAEALGRG
jgi:hypothetical protein